MKTQVSYTCNINIVSFDDQVFSDQYKGSFTIDDDIEADFGGIDTFLIPEILREAMYNLDEIKNNSDGFSECKKMQFELVEYHVEFIED